MKREGPDSSPNGISRESPRPADHFPVANAKEIKNARISFPIPWGYGFAADDARGCQLDASKDIRAPISSNRRPEWRRCGYQDHELEPSGSSRPGWLRTNSRRPLPARRRHWRRSGRLRGRASLVRSVGQLSPNEGKVVTPPPALTILVR